MKKMTQYAFFDVDKTIYPGYTANDFIEIAVETGLCKKEMKNRMESIVEALQTGRLNYHNASQEIMNLLGEIVEKKTENEVNKTIDKLFEQKDLIEWFPPLYKKLKDEGYETYFVSGGASFLIRRLAERIDKEITVLSTEYILDSEGKYIRQISSILNGEAKAVKLRGILGESTYSIGFGDSIGDIPMLKEVDQGYLYNPNEKLLEVAENEGFIVFNDETTLNIPELENSEINIRS